MIKYKHTAELDIEGRIITLKSVYNPGGLDFDFTVRRQRFEVHPEISVIIYNINDETYKALTKKSESDQFYNISQITCKAGYQGDNKLIFSGTVTSAKTTFAPGEQITNVRVSSYSERLARKQVSRSYRVAPDISVVLQDFASDAGVTVNTSRISTADDKPITSKAGFSFQGTITDLITMISSSNPNITAEYYNDTVFVYSISDQSTPTPIETLNKNTGMILSPTVTDQNLIRVQALFNPIYQINSFIKVESDYFHQPVVQGEIYKLEHNFTAAIATSTIEILPEGQAVPRNNLGVGV